MTMLATPSSGLSPAAQAQALGQGPRLMVPKAVASQHIRAHIQRGIAIRRQRIRYIEDLEDVRALKGEWVQSYTETLKQLFSTSDIADECNDWVGKVYPEFADVTLFVEQFYEEMDYRTDKLRGVLKRLEDLGEYIPRTITSAPPQAASSSPMMPEAPTMFSSPAPAPAPAPAPPPAPVMQTPQAPIPAQAPTVTVTVTSNAAPAPAPAPAPKAAAPAHRSAPAPAPAPAPELAPPPSSDVVPPLNCGIFVVHGDLQPTVNTINAFMDDLGIQLQALPAHPERAKGLVNSLEKNPDASFALVLLGHDDAVALRRSAADASAGVRSGIVFELGYFVGRLGLKRVCVLYTGGTETFISDHGIQFLPIDSGNGWQLQLARHLKRAGIEIDLNKLF